MEDDNDNLKPEQPSVELMWYHIFWFDVCCLLGRKLFPSYEPSSEVTKIFKQMDLVINRHRNDIFEDELYFKFVDNVRVIRNSLSENQPKLKNNNSKFLSL